MLATPLPKRLFLLAALCACAAAWTDADEKFIGSRRNYWAFKKPVRPAAPSSGDPWVRTPIDAFLLEALRAKALSPNPPLDRAALLRRLTLDLTGLPPTPAELSEFLRDPSAAAYDKVVDRLLASPHYGERWALKWLDVVRYADTNGYELDVERPNAWRYRDYVIRAFNEDKPYDRFLREQVAGDELSPGDPDAVIATGFHRAGPLHVVGGNQDKEMLRQEVLTEMTGAVGSAFLGLTVGCARCHNHKFDPILQADYYRLQAVFAATDLKDVEIASAEEKAAYERAKKDYEARLKPIQDEIAQIEKPYRARLSAAKEARLDPQLLNALRTPEEKRTEEEKRLAKEAKAQTKLDWDEVVAALEPAEKERRAALRRRMHAIELAHRPEPLRAAYAVANMEKAPVTYILKVGDHNQKIAPVDPGFLAVLAPKADMPSGPNGRRSALANWLASPDHPLTARVMVNRIWQARMGAGLVATPNDFGVLGRRPSNQKLLDWLATEFIAKGWSVKALDRLIVRSNAYQQAPFFGELKAKMDPENTLYWRANRRRLEGETLRDSVLAVAGTLNPKPYGRPVRVPIEPEIYDLIFTEGEPDNLWPVLPDEREHNRRSLYLLNKRTVRLPLLMNFDQPDAMTSCPVRPVSTHALQALSLMNSDFMARQSKAFAERLMRACSTDRACQVSRAYELALARPPRPEETELSGKFFAAGHLLQDFCLALLNRNEFLYLP